MKIDPSDKNNLAYFKPPRGYFTWSEAKQRAWAQRVAAVIAAKRMETLVGPVSDQSG